MGIISIILIAITEAMDCFAVSISTGLSKSGIKYSKAVLQSFSFGFFQGGMTLLGYFLGSATERWVSSIGTPIACGILCILGCRMIWEATHEKEEEESPRDLSIKSILLLSIATSIDAFAVGVSFAYMNVNLIFATSAIAIASFVIAHLGFEIGRRSAKHFKTKIPEIISGFILIGIGVKLLF